MTGIPSTPSAIDTARKYLQRGWRVLPVPYQSKNPGFEGWQNTRLTEADIPTRFRGRCNVGVLWGEPSGGVVDVDLDHPLAVELADKFLPPTQSEFGRRGKPRSHRLYRVTAPCNTLQRRLPKGPDGKAPMIVELRSTGTQTIMPGSVHDSGEPIEWHEDGEPARIDPAELKALVDALANEALRRLGIDAAAKPKRLARGTSNGPARHHDRLVVIERAKKYLAKVPPAISGQGGHSHTFYAACQIVQGFDLSPGDALDVMSEWNMTCQPPWSEKELRHKVDDADKRSGPRGDLLDGERGRSASVSDNGAAKSEMAVDDPWPDRIDDAAFHGLPGEIVRTIEPHSEADPVALLAQILVAFGNVIGRTAYFRAEADRHYGNLFTTLVGRTGKGRKGTSWGQVKTVLGAVDETWCTDRVAGGLSSGEGLIWAVRDAITKSEPIREGKGKDARIAGYQDVIVDQGVTDKRLLVLESEFSSVLKVIAREKNTLSAVMRHAWDTGTLRTMTKNSPATATNSHISIVGHITRDELRRQITETDLANGLANRFLWICVRRSKSLPEGGALHTVNMADIARRIRGAVEFAGQTGELQRDNNARANWADVYPTLSDGKPGLLGAVVSRAEAQVMRLAMIYALLDLSPAIRSEHLMAALAVWQYAEASARYIFGSALGDPTADEIHAELRRRSPEGMTRTQIREHFGRHKRSEEISRALAVLLEYDLARRESTTDTGGRPAETWFARV